MTTTTPEKPVVEEHELVELWISGSRMRFTVPEEISSKELKKTIDTTKVILNAMENMFELVSEEEQKKEKIEEETN